MTAPIAQLWVATSIFCVAIFFTGCNPYAQVEKDRARFSSIAKDRTLGSPCSQSDSASIKRRMYHPLGPTGGWMSKVTGVNYTRTSDRKNNIIEAHAMNFAGYLKFESKGFVQMRSYDDVYGSVYCGWSPQKLELQATDKAVFVELGRCSVGDGGLDQVHEACWFQDGAKEGTIIFSSYHKGSSKPLRTSEVFQMKDLGHEMYFNDRVAFRVIAEKSKDGDDDGAIEIAKESIKLIERMRPGIEFQSKREIPGKEMRKREWVQLQQFMLGTQIGSNQFQPRLIALKEDMQANTWGGTCFQCQYFQKIEKIAEWLHSQLLEKASQLPEFDQSSSNIMGRDPRKIIPYLRGELSEEKFTKYRSNYYPFWVGAKKFLDGDKLAAKKSLDRYIEQMTIGELSFEFGAAIALRQKLNSDHPSSHAP